MVYRRGHSRGACAITIIYGVLKDLITKPPSASTSVFAGTESSLLLLLFLFGVAYSAVQCTCTVQFHFVLVLAAGSAAAFTFTADSRTPSFIQDSDSDSR
jgi:hypothetical protein